MIDPKLLTPPVILLGPVIKPDGEENLLPSTEGEIDNCTLSKFKHKRTQKQILDDMEIVEDMWVKGHSQREIAEHISSIRPYTISREQIRYEMQRMNKTLKTRQIRAPAVSKAQALRRCDFIYRTAYEAYLKSTEPSQSIRREFGGEGEGEGTKEKLSKTVRESEKREAGNPQFLALMLKVEEHRARLEGTMAPTKGEISATTEHTFDIEKARLSYRRSQLAQARLEESQKLLAAKAIELVPKQS